MKATTMGADILIEEIDGWVAATTMARDVEGTVSNASGSGANKVKIRTINGNVYLKRAH